MYCWLKILFFTSVAFFLFSFCHGPKILLLKPMKNDAFLLSACAAMGGLQENFLGYVTRAKKDSGQAKRETSWFSSWLTWIKCFFFSPTLFFLCVSYMETFLSLFVYLWIWYPREELAGRKLYEKVFEKRAVGLLISKTWWYIRKKTVLFAKGFLPFSMFPIGLIRDRDDVLMPGHVFPSC